MVDAGDQLPVSCCLDAAFAEHRVRAGLDAVAKADGFDFCIPLHKAGQHRHRVGVIEEPCVRTDGLHIPCDPAQNGDRAQRAENAADPERISDGLAQAVFLGDLKIDDRAGLIKPDLDRIDDKVRAGKRCTPVFGAEIRPDHRAVLVDAAVQGQNQLF